MLRTKRRASQCQREAFVCGNRVVRDERVQRVTGRNVDNIQKDARIGSLRPEPSRDGTRELRAIQQRVGIGPLLRRVTEPLRRLRRPQWMPQLAQYRHRAVIHVACIERAEHRDEPVLRRAEFSRRVGPRLGEIDQREGHGA
jgi:hypothetical protein